MKKRIETEKELVKTLKCDELCALKPKNRKAVEEERKDKECGECFEY